MNPRVQNLHDFYKIVISSAELGIVVKANLREDLSVGTNSEWTAMVDGAEAPGTVGMGVRLVANKTGVSPTLFNKLHSTQVWMGTSPLAFRLNLQFVAINDPRAEVLTPTLDLLSLVFPTNELGGIYSTPDYNVSVTIGAFFGCSEMIVKSVMPVFWREMTPEGIPLGADVEVELQTSYTPIVPQVRKYFGA